MSFSFILSANSNSSSTEYTSLLTGENTGDSANTVSLLNDNSGDDCGFDAFGGKDLFGETPTFSAANESLFAASASTETAGSVAYNSSETVGSVACASETVGSVACASEAAGSVASAGPSCGGGSFSSVC